jgi:hypothetical protein
MVSVQPLQTTRPGWRHHLRITKGRAELEGLIVARIEGRHIVKAPPTKPGTYGLITLAIENSFRRSEFRVHHRAS